MRQFAEDGDSAREAARPFRQVESFSSKGTDMHCQLDQMAREQYAIEYRQRNVFTLIIPVG